jgi:photosystem II stability/assembly factor-like uncharacterized protein
MKIRESLLIGALMVAMSASASAQGPGFVPPGRWAVGAIKLIAPGVGWAEATTTRGLLWTENGGAKWRDITPPHLAGDEVLDSIFFLDRSRGWITINHDQEASLKEPQFDLASTIDAGATWSRITVPLRPKDYGISPGPLHGGAGEVAFVDPLHGWMNVWFTVSPNTWWSFLLLTSDGGRSWKRAARAPEMSSSEMLLVTPSEGWLYGEDHDGGWGLYVTRDGARHWNEVAPQVEGIGINGCAGVPTFKDAKHGFLQVRGTAGAGRIWRWASGLLATSDGGRSWKFDRAVINLSDESRQRYDSATVVGSDWIFANVVGHRPVLTKVAAGERLDASLGTGASRPGSGVRHINFVTPNQGWVVADDFALFSTTDGGARWTDITPGAKPRVVQP